MEISTLQYKGYTAKVTNVSKGEDVTDWVSECNISLPNTSLISSMEAKFQLNDKKIDKGNEVKIEILDEIKNILYSLQGEAHISKRTKSYTGTEIWEYSIKDTYSKLFEKIVPESITYYDLYLCNIEDKENSLLHKIGRALGFKDEEMDFINVVYDNGVLIRIPFLYLEENTRWIDKLQGFIEASDGVLYIKNKKLFFRPRNFQINKDISFNITNIKSILEETEKEITQNGVKIIYDRFEKLENQTVFNLSQKIITEPNIKMDVPEVPVIRINYITSAVSNPVLIKATGYYFTTDKLESKVNITLKENEHYKIESWKETGAEIKFYNPYPHKLYVDNFEIKGIPLAMYEDNEVSVMYPNILEKYQENFILTNKNKFIQTSKHAQFIAEKVMKREVVNNKEYHFKTPFLHQIEIGNIYNLDLEDIHTILEIKNISINLKPGNFTMDIKGNSIKEELEGIKTTKKLSGNSKEQFIDLSSIKDQITEKYDKKLSGITEDIKAVKISTEIVNNKISAKAFIQEEEPKKGIKSNDIWYNPKTNVYKIWLNNKWVPASEDDIFPALRHFASLKNSQLEMGKTIDKVNTRAGLFLTNNDQKFGVKNGTLAEVSLDKQGTIRLANANNLLEWNVKDSKNPSKIKSKLYMGVTDVTKVPENVYFKIGDSSNGFSLEFKEGSSGKALINGKELGEKLGEVDTNINNLSSQNRETLNTAKNYTDSKKIEIDKNIENLSKKDAELSKQISLSKGDAINNAKVYTDNKKKEVDTKFNELQKKQNDFETEVTVNFDSYESTLKSGNFIITGNTIFDGKANIVSKGENERIQINSGSIEFFRTLLGVEKKLTQIKNIRYGTIATDSKGKGVITFEGFKQPMVVYPTAKNVNFGKNMASMFCYAELIDPQKCQYRFYLGGTTEYRTTPVPVKVVGQEYSLNKVLTTTLLEYTGNYKGFKKEISPSFEKKDRYNKMKNYPDYKTVLKKPKFNLKIIRVENNSETVLVDKDYTFEIEYQKYNGSSISHPSINLNSVVNIVKKFNNRTNVVYKIKITILEKDYEIDLNYKFSYKYGKDGHGIRYKQYKGVYYTLTPDQFTGFSITASSETSTIGEAAGDGEVNYIALEIE